MAVNGSRECLVLLLLERIECDGIVEGGVAELAKQETTGHSLGQARDKDKRRIIVQWPCGQA